MKEFRSNAESGDDDKDEGIIFQMNFVAASLKNRPETMSHSVACFGNCLELRLKFSTSGERRVWGRVGPSADRIEETQPRCPGPPGLQIRLFSKYFDV